MNWPSWSFVVRMLVTWVAGRNRGCTLVGPAARTSRWRSSARVQLITASVVFCCSDAENVVNRSRLGTLVMLNAPVERVVRTWYDVAPEAPPRATGLPRARREATMAGSDRSNCEVAPPFEGEARDRRVVGDVDGLLRAVTELVGGHHVVVDLFAAERVVHEVLRLARACLGAGCSTPGPPTGDVERKPGSAGLVRVGSTGSRAPLVAEPTAA